MHPWHRTQVRDALRSLLPGSSEETGHDFDLSYEHNERDPEENANSTPPSCESISTPCLWAVEYYPPSRYEKLLSGFSTLGWDDSVEIFARQSPLEWLNSARSQPHAGGWWSVGFVARESDPRNWLSRTRRLDDAKFPSGVTEMRPWVHLPVASHAAVAIEFALSDEYANRIHEILSNDYQSYIEPVEGGYITHSVENQIKDNISDFRTRLRTNISDWYCNHIPGVLTSSSQGSNLPTVELTLFDYEEPFEGERGCGPGYYLDLMRMSGPFNAWESKAYDGLKIGSLGTRDWRAPHLVATANRAHLFEGDDLGGWGGRTDSGFRNRLNSFHAWVTYWGLTQLLSAYETTMSSIRDGMLATNGNTNADDLLGLAGDLRAFERDCIPFLTDFDQHYDRDGSFDYRSFGFERIEPRWQDSTPNLLESVRANIAFRGQHLSKLIDDLGDSIIGSASLASTSSSRTLQRRIHILTWVVALSALVTLGQALSDIGFVSNIYDSVVVGVQSVVGDIS